MGHLSYVILCTFLSFLVIPLKSQVEVKEKPRLPIRTHAIEECKVRYMWVPGQWKWDTSSEQYVWEEGKCIKRKKNHKWEHGKWEKTPNGWIWQPGKWVKYKYDSKKRDFSDL